MTICNIQLLGKWGSRKEMTAGRKIDRKFAIAQVNKEIWLSVNTNEWIIIYCKELKMGVKNNQ